MTTEARRHLPSMNRLTEHPLCAALDAPRAVVISAARTVIERARQQLASGGETALDLDALAAQVVDVVRASLGGLLPAVINGTGIVLHTGLGRAPLPRAAIAALGGLADTYAPVELDLEAGRRGRRADVVESLLCELTGAEAATVMNNNAAAMLVTMAAVAGGRRVIVSRGELIEIGGSFRLPEVLEAGGAELGEVGTTNRTRVADYEGAIDDRCAALLKVHPSNFRVEGFTAEVTVSELVALGRRHGIPVIHDIGSGALESLDDLGLHGEPTVRDSIASGADLVLFSGDKLLGGPQAGIVVGKKALIERVERHPLMRAVRTGKLTLVALGATLQLHRDAATARREIPAYRLLAAAGQELQSRGLAIVNAVGHSALSVIETEGYAGGGSVPEQTIAGYGLAIDAAGRAEAITGALRSATPAVLPRIEKGRVVIDLRTVFEEQDVQLISVLKQMVGAE